MQPHHFLSFDAPGFQPAILGELVAIGSRGDQSPDPRHFIPLVQGDAFKVRRRVTDWASIRVRFDLPLAGVALDHLKGGGFSRAPAHESSRFAATRA